MSGLPARIGMVGNYDGTEIPLLCMRNLKTGPYFQ